jgi:hypothetical protein
MAMLRCHEGSVIVTLVRVIRRSANKPSSVGHTSIATEYEGEPTEEGQSFFGRILAGEAKWRRDPREEPEGVERFTLFGKHVAALREACGGLVQRLELDWVEGTVKATCLVPKHISQTDFVDAIKLRFGVIERRMILAASNDVADDFATKKLVTLLPPCPEA